MSSRKSTSRHAYDPYAIAESDDPHDRTSPGTADCRPYRTAASRRAYVTDPVMKVLCRSVSLKVGIPAINNFPSLAYNLYSDGG